MQAILVQALTGLAGASTLFLVAAGLTVIFGVTRVVNFAHGSLAMLGAYLGWSILARLPATPLGFAAGALAAALAVAACGLVLEMLVLRRIYRAPELLQLLATFGVVLVVQDAVLFLWGPDDLTLPRPAWMRASVPLAGARFPAFDLVLIAAGPLVLAGLALLFRRTRFGVLVRAATEDRDMLAALGVNQAVLFSAVFALGAGLAGLAGVLGLPPGSANLSIDLSLITDAFVVVVVGGLGSVAGAYLAALLLGELQAFGVVLFPQGTLVLAFVAMALVLTVRPFGLLGRAAPPGREAGEVAWVTRAPRPARWLGWTALALAAAAPLALGPFGLSVATEMVLAVLFAASLHFMMGPGGMASFGHAAWFGVGAYAVALAAHAGWPVPAALAGAVAAAALLAGAAGVVVVRLQGVYLAMLTLAVAQIVWAAAFQWVGLTGGDNGLLDVSPGMGTVAFYLLALALGAGGALLLRRALYAPFGFALRAARDSELRAGAIGLHPVALRLAAFAISAGAAGLAGGLFAYAKRSVFPTYVAVGHSVDALVMVLLGGVQTMAGPLVGGAAYTLLYDTLLGAGFWRFKLGLAILALVLFFPDGIAGAALRRWRRG